MATTNITWTRIMTLARVACVGAICCLSFATLASAQAAPSQIGTGARRSTDPLDPLAQAVRSVHRPSASRPEASPLTRSSVDSEGYQAYLQRYNQYLADYAQYREEVAASNRTPGWAKVMQGISAGLELTHQAIDVYEHGLEARALAQSYRQQQ